MKAQQIAKSEDSLRAILSDYLNNNQDKYKLRQLKYATRLQKPQIERFLSGESSLTMRKAVEAAEFLKTKGY